jgi:UDPglucose 6-dehydrogenase
MKVGFIGLGKLGLPCALAAEDCGHEVYGWDVSDSVRENVESRLITYQEIYAQEMLDASSIPQRLLPSDELGEVCDLIFVAVQTPHQPEYEGITRLPATREDFNYEHLAKALESVADAKCPVAVISTVLPGTMEKLGVNKQIIYNPFFIAMGTTIPDFLNPEFVLVGTDRPHPGVLKAFYESIHTKPVFVTTVKTAELTKVAYNTFIGLKIAFANTMMELCEKTGADVDDLVDALSLATDRIISSRYLRGGMGDGGGCHPRDNIALSWLAREVGLSYDLFEALMVAREKQTEWLLDVALDAQNESAEFRPLEIKGKAYKPKTNLTVGSPALLMVSMLEERGKLYEHTDPHVDNP